MNYRAAPGRAVHEPCRQATRRNGGSTLQRFWTWKKRVSEGPYYIVTWHGFPGGKAADAWLWPPTPYSVQVNEKVELYLYFPSGPSWPVLGWTLPFFWRGGAFYLAWENWVFDSCNSKVLHKYSQSFSDNFCESWIVYVISVVWGQQRHCFYWPLWYDMIFVKLQLGCHPVAVVQYTFTHKQYTERHKANNT